ncbi:protein kinase family protein [Peterkaempfera griseoplana]|uniref:hypothetical protein n=1 Tax=Peterkaempfera griseoplana TaxID=66896 RepID=UPI0006E2E6F2|nr:hypothetical protein [Peterkaempfera griseoplana]
MPPVYGRLLAGRYQLMDRPEDLAAPRRRAAVDSASGLRVVLEAVPLPEVVSAEVLDDGLDTVYGLAPEEAAPTAGAAARAVDRAARAVAAVPVHPRLLQDFEVFHQDGYLWVAGEYLPGVPLARLLERGPLPVHRAAEIAGDLLGALQAVHAAGLVHGNITPETVLVCEDGAAMLGGLGSGAAQEALSEGLDADPSGVALPLGTDWTLARRRARDSRAALAGPRAERWAPEQVGPPGGDRGPQLQLQRPLPGEPVGPAADCWALGVLLFRLLTGRPPFPEEDTGVLFDAVRAGRRAPGASCGALRPLVEELLHPDPAARPAPAQVRRRLSELLTRAPEPYDPDTAGVAALLPAVRPAGTVERRRRRGGLPQPHPDHPHGPPRHARRGLRPGSLGPLLVGGIVLVLLLVLGVTALLAG